MYYCSPNKCVYRYVWCVRALCSQVIMMVHAVGYIHCYFFVFSLLFISYKFFKGFLAITFLLLVISCWNFHDVRQRFLYNQKPNFSWIQQKTTNFPMTPIIKTAHIYYVMSNIVCRSQLKFGFWLYKKKLTHIMQVSVRHKK